MLLRCKFDVFNFNYKIIFIFYSPITVINTPLVLSNQTIAKIYQNKRNSNGNMDNTNVSYAINSSIIENRPSTSSSGMQLIQPIETNQKSNLNTSTNQQEKALQNFRNRISNISTNSSQNVNKGISKKVVQKVIDTEHEEILKQLERKFANTLDNVAKGIMVQSNSQENSKYETV